MVVDDLDIFCLAQMTWWLWTKNRRKGVHTSYSHWYLCAT